MASGHVTPKDIYLALTKAGASTTQAIGIMANMMNESGLNPEAINPAGPQSGVGLVQWQTTDYPHAATLVTGNPEADMRAQVNYLAVTGGFKAAQGTTAGQAAGNFAANYEKCATCQAGGQQFRARVENTLTIAGWIAAGKWPHATANPHAAGDVSTSAGPGSTPDCAWKIDLNVPLIGGNFCIITKSELRGIAGLALMVAGGAVALAGLAVLMVAAGMKAAGPLGSAAEVVGAGVALVPGGEAAGAGIAAAGAGAKHISKGRGQAVAQRRQARAAREETAQRKQLGEPRENPDMEARGGTVRQSPAQRSAQRSRERRRASGETPPF